MLRVALNTGRIVASNATIDPVERLRHIAEFWNWLPAFRAIAETSHLPSAAAILHLSPSALSRSLQQLENRLGRKLFPRANRRLELTREGELGREEETRSGPANLG